MKKLFYIIVLSAAFFSACKKGTLVENTAYEKLEPGNTKYAYLKLLNASPGAPLINFYINGKKFSSVYTSSGIENDGFAYNGLFPNLGYANTLPGAQTLSATTLANATIDPGLEVYKTSITPEGGKYYSVFATGNYDAVAKKIPSTIVFNDVRPATDTTRIFIRFVNLYSGGPSLDMAQTLDGQKIVSNVAFGTTSDWVTIPNAGQSNKYAFFNSSTGDALPATITATLTKGRAYTFYSIGAEGNTDFPFKLGFYTTFY